MVRGSSQILLSPGIREELRSQLWVQVLKFPFGGGGTGLLRSIMALEQPWEMGQVSLTKSRAVYSAEEA